MTESRTARSTPRRAHPATRTPSIGSIARLPAASALLRWLLVAAVFGATIVAALPSPEAGAASPSDRFGFAFVNGVEEATGRAGTSADWYAKARDAGARWNRWPIYWHKIETARGVFDYTNAYPADSVVDADVRNGLKTNAILIGTPTWAGISSVSAASVRYPFDVSRKRFEPLPVSAAASGSPAAVPQGLDEPVLLNGQINPKNTYGYFVYNTVQRYKPGGALAQQRGWGPGQGVTVWEIWNEPDLKDGAGNGIFWFGGVDDYYKLLKVGFQAVRAADPTAAVMLAGLAYWSDQAFLGNLLNRIAADPAARTNGFFFDIMALHFYTNVRDVYDKTIWARQELAARGISKPIWMNETNLPVYGDTTGYGSPVTWSGTVDEQARYVIQAMAYALAADIDRLFVFQLYEDGEPTFGIVRRDGNPRPALTAYRVGATYLQDASFESRTVQNGVEIIRAVSPTRGRVTVVWNTGTSAANVSVPASTGTATVIDRTGASWTIAATGGSYQLTVAGGYDYRAGAIAWHVDGEPLIVVESGSFTVPTATPVAATATPVPTIPVVTISTKMNDLPSTSPPVPFEVSWARTDVFGGDGRFDVQYRTDQQSSWTYLVTDSKITSLPFGQNDTPTRLEPGRTYFFRARVRMGAMTEEWPVSDQGDTFTVLITPTTSLRLPILASGNPSK